MLDWNIEIDYINIYVKINSVAAHLILVYVGIIPYLCFQAAGKLRMWMPLSISADAAKLLVSLWWATLH